MAKKSSVPARVSKLQLECMKLLAKKGEMTRPELSAALDNAFIGSSTMGHLEKGDVEPASLRGRGLVTVNVYPSEGGEGEGQAHYQLTAAGKKALPVQIELHKALATGASKRAKPAKKAPKAKAKKKAAKKRPATAAPVPAPAA